MANTLAGVSHDNVARIGLDAFADGLVSLKGFTTDYSTEAVQGTTVSTRIVPVAGTVGDLNDTHSGSYSDAIDDQVLSQVQITLGSDPIIGFQFTDQEVTQMNNGVYSDTVQRLIKQAAYAVANKIQDTVWAAVDTTFTAGVSAVLAADFGADEMFDARADFVANAGSMGEGPVCVLNPSYYSALGKDGAIQDNSKSQLDALVSGEIPRVAGFDILEAPSLPGAAVNNTVGFCALPSAMAIAMRPISAGPEVENDLVAYEVLQHPSGAVLNYQSWVIRDTRALAHSFSIQWGLADGVTSSLRRITSA